jgi:hypothetical protein
VDRHLVIASRREQAAVGGESDRRDDRWDVVDRGFRDVERGASRLRRVIFRAFGDPAADELDLLGRQGVLAFRHLRLLTAGQHEVEEALIGFPGHQLRALAPALRQRLERGEVELASALRGLMAALAAPLEEAAYGAMKADRRRRLVRRRSSLADPERHRGEPPGG